MIEEDEIDIELENEDDVIIVTDLSKIKDKIKPKSTKRPRVIGKHSLNYDVIHNSKVEKAEEDEEYIIPELNSSFNVIPSFNTEDTYNTDEYYLDLQLKNKMYDILVNIEGIDFTEGKKRLPSNDLLNSYYQLLLDELLIFGYSYCEIFIAYSEIFTDNIWNAYKRMKMEYKNNILKELKEKYNISEIDDLEIF